MVSAWFTSLLPAIYPRHVRGVVGQTEHAPITWTIALRSLGHCGRYTGSIGGKTTCWMILEPQQYHLIWPPSKIIPMKSLFRLFQQKGFSILRIYLKMGHTNEKERVWWEQWRWTLGIVFPQHFHSTSTPTWIPTEGFLTSTPRRKAESRWLLTGLWTWRVDKRRKHVCMVFCIQHVWCHTSTSILTQCGAP